MYSWSCSCGDGGAARTLTPEEARRQGELHLCRAGRLRAQHAITVREHGAHPAFSAEA